MLGLAFGMALVLALPAAAAAQDEEHPGKPVYDQWCAGCHGVDGAGAGPAAGYMLPRPRDFTQALYQVRTTQSGALPTDEDILHVIDEGMPGTAMPGWRQHLSRRERDALVDYLKTFSPFFETLPPEEPLEFGRPPRVTEEALAEGRSFYEQIECWKCHGDSGRANGESSPTLEDDRGRPIRAADLTENWRFNGGGTVEDIYRRLRTGMDGTPMPSFSDLLESGFMTDEQLWNLAHYVRSLSPERAPRVRDVVRARLLAEGETLPSAPADEAWAEVERFYIPLVGQIIAEPRWFDPMVDGVWVQALHDGSELALRVSWNDPSMSPDETWREWQEKVLSLMEPKEGPEAAAPGPRPDALAVQFPRRIPEGREHPYFLMGDTREPVYLWQWRSAAPGAASPAPGGITGEATASGLGRIEMLDDESTVRANAAYEDGQWQVVFRRAIEPAGEAGEPRIRFESGLPIPIAFFAWDGSNGEDGTRGSVSSWYYLYLDAPTPTTVYTTPIVAMILTACMGLVVVVRAQRREHGPNGHDRDDES